MGGAAKGLLHAPGGEPIVLRTQRLFAELGIDCVLVGAHPAYRNLGLELLVDDGAAEGPLAGILALLERAGDRNVVAVACDMPFIEKALLARLIDAPPAPVVAPRRHDPERNRRVWEPLFARYAPSVRPAAYAYARRGGRKLQELLDLAGAQPLDLVPTDESSLIDWDTLPVASTHDNKDA